MIEIRRAGPQDRQTVLELVERLLTELEDLPKEFAGLDRDRTLFDLANAGDTFTAFVARTMSGEAVGVLTVSETFAIYAGGRYGVIDEMYVDPGHRSAGVGRGLLEAAKELGRVRGWRRIDVTAPPGAAWDRTVRFYEGHGFVFTGPKMRCLLTGI